MSNKCIGCGIELQDIDKSMDGYVSRDNYRLCERCFKIKNYGVNNEIKVSNEDYFKILDKINDNDLVVYVSSLLTMDMSYINRFKNVILVLTKRDVMPKSIKDEKIVKYVSSRYGIKDIVIVSACKKYNLDCLYNKLKKLGNGKKIYFVGSTNSGKSTLINEMIKSYNGCEGEITTSAFPSTTLSEINVQIGDMDIIDTPGIVNDESIINSLSVKDTKKLNSKKEIKPITFQVKGKGSIMVDELVRIDYETNISSMTFYVSNSLMVDKISLNNNRLLDGKKKSLIVKDNQDIELMDIGFIKITNGMKVDIYYKDKMDIRVRDNLI